MDKPRSGLAHLWNKTVDKTLDPVFVSLSSSSYYLVVKIMGWITFQHY